MRPLTSALILSCLLLLACENGTNVRDLSRPNIVFAFADDMGKYASCYAEIDGPNSINALIATPNIDRIAREGILFKNAFVNAPSCTPCRSSLLSGQQFYRTGLGAILQGAEWDDSIPTFPLLLEQDGYHIGYTHKVWSPGSPRDAGYGGEANKYQGSTSFNRFSQNVVKFMADDKISLDSAKAILLAETRDDFNDFLTRRNEDQPFCYWWGPTNVHRKWIYGSGETMWGINPNDLRGRMPEFLPDVDTVRTDFADYLGEIVAFDAGLGVLIDHLAEIGELDNTLIVVSGDHGVPGMSRGKCNLYDFGVQVPLVMRWPEVIKPGRVVDDLVSLPDLAPTFLEVADVNVPSIMTSKSLCPILNHGGSGVIEIDRDHVIVGRERHVREARAGALPYPQRALRTAEYLYIINFAPDRYPMGDPLVVDDDYNTDRIELTENTFHAFGDYDGSPTKAWIVAHRRDPAYSKYYDWAFGKRPDEELYVLNSDPDQINNVAGDPTYIEVKKRLRERLLSLLRETGDPRLLEDPVRYEYPPYAGG